MWWRESIRAASFFNTDPGEASTGEFGSPLQKEGLRSSGISKHCLANWGSSYSNPEKSKGHKASMSSSTTQLAWASQAWVDKW